MIDEAIAGLRVGQPVVLPTDTVYGLCAVATDETAVRRAYTLKGREERQPSALLAPSIDVLFELVPEAVGPIARALLPGPFTLVVPNPGRRFAWLTGERPETLGVRVPDLPSPAAEVVAAAGAVMATSANLPGGPDPRRLDDVPEQIRAGSAALVDGGELPGVPSTVVDLTGASPKILREGAAPADETLELIAAVTA